jgi:hypothetical protein
MTVLEESFSGLLRVSNHEAIYFEDLAIRCIDVQSIVSICEEAY